MGSRAEQVFLVEGPLNGGALSPDDKFLAIAHGGMITIYSTAKDCFDIRETLAGPAKTYRISNDSDVLQAQQTRYTSS